jgi:hypothetical protein
LTHVFQIVLDISFLRCGIQGCILYAGSRQLLRLAPLCQESCVFDADFDMFWPTPGTPDSTHNALLSIEPRISQMQLFVTSYKKWFIKRRSEIPDAGAPGLCMPEAHYHSNAPFFLLEIFVGLRETQYLELIPSTQITLARELS